MNIRKKIIIMLTAIIGILIATYFGFTAKDVKVDPDNVTINAAIEQDTATSHPYFIVEEYVPIVPEGTNIALDAKFTSNGFQAVYTPMKVKDGNPNGTSYWEGIANSYPNILTAQLSEATLIHTIRIRLCPATIWGKREQSFEIQTSTDGETFATLVSMTTYMFDPSKGNEVVVDFEKIETKYVQIVFIENTGASGAQVSELEIYSD